MSDKTLKILLGIIAVNLTFQTVKDVGFFPTAFAQGIQRVTICGNSGRCADVESTTAPSPVNGRPTEFQTLMMFQWPPND